jgi:hypothetical protein
MTVAWAAALVMPSVTGAAWAAEEMNVMPIEGTVDVADGVAVAPGDRLILKLHHPDEGIEKDTKYQIYESFELPFAFRAAPSVDMNAKARWPSYVIEIFTDRDGDILSQVDGELAARTPEPVPLGATGLTLTLVPIAVGD